MIRVLSITTVLMLAVYACGGDGGSAEEPYDTYQECFDDHTMVETLPVQEAIVVCCLEHPIAGEKPACGNTAADCVTYLGANLSPTSASSADVSAACDTYVTQKGM